MMNKRARKGRFTLAFLGITAGVWALFAPNADATGQHRHADDCTLVAKADRTLCIQVQKQRAYGWTYGPHNEGRATNPSGIVDVHDVTHQGYTRAEIHDNLIGLRAQYREHVTRVTVDVDKLKPGCQYIVETIPDNGPNGTGIRLTQVVTVCP